MSEMCIKITCIAALEIHSSDVGIGPVRDSSL